MSLFLDILPKTRYVGEVGLDNFNKSQEDFTGQKRIFEQIVSACSTQPGKILTVHSRRAEKEVLDIFGEGFPGKVILHWFSGPKKELQRALSKGFYISVNYKMINSENGKKIIEATPADRLLLETDGPFVEINDKPCTPSATGPIAQGVFSIKSSLGEILPQSLFYDNFKALLS
jgi:TatD DNase family protein